MGLCTDHHLHMVHKTAISVCVKLKRAVPRRARSRLPSVQLPSKSRALSFIYNTSFQTRVLIRIPVFRAVQMHAPVHLRCMLVCVTSISDWYIAIMFTEYTKKRILFYHAKGRRALMIAKLLEEGVVVSRQGVDASLVRVLQTGDIARHPGRGQPSMRTDEVEVVKQLKSLLLSNSLCCLNCCCCSLKSDR